MIKQFTAEVIGRWDSRRWPNQSDRLVESRQSDEWALIVFDALRYDVAASVLPLVFKGQIECLWSVAHDTFEWGRKAWGQRTHDATYVSGAVPFNNESFEADGFDSLYEGWNPTETLPNLEMAWRECWDADLGTVPPESLTDFAVDYAECDELVVHYFQPHAPYIGSLSLLGHTEGRSSRPLQGEPVDEPLWERVKDGRVSLRTLQLAYRANLWRAVEAAVPLIERLLSQDRQVVITADHGELLGRRDPELLMHPRQPWPEIRRVPWLSVDGIRSQPSSHGSDTEASVADRLKSLGYR